MMKNTNRKNIIRRALSFVFALTLLWETGALTPPTRAAEVSATDGTVNLVFWDVVLVGNVQNNLARLCSDAQHPILISYRDDKKDYFVCATKENWRWESKDYNLYDMPQISDHRFDDMREDWKNAQRFENDVFVTFGTYNSLWARYKMDGKYSGLVFNVSNGNDGPGEFLGPGKAYDDETYGGHKVRDTCFVVRPQETKPFRFTRDDDAYAFRMWNYDKDGDDEDVKFNGSKIALSDDHKDFFEKVHVGTVVTASVLTHDFTVQADQATTMGRPVSYIAEGVTLRVANGGVLAVNGLLYNDGRIVVEEGGLLVVEKDSAIEPFHEQKANCGGISSAGTIVVEKNAFLVGGGVNGIYLTGGIVYNSGVIVSENFTAKKNLLIDNQKKAHVVAGKTLPSRWQNQLFRDIYLHRKGGEAPSYDLHWLERSCAYILPSGKVSIAEGAIYGDMTNVENCGSFGSLGTKTSAMAVSVSEIVKVYFYDESGWSNVLNARRSEIGYHLSDTGRKVTRREVLYADKTTETLRELFAKKYDAEHGNTGTEDEREAAFKEYMEAYFAGRGVDLNEAVTVRDGVITINGLAALTVPWNQKFAIVDPMRNYLIGQTTPFALGDSGIG